MIVEEGSQQLLTAELTYLAGLYWGLFTSNTPDASGNVLGTYTEAAWAGYARQLVGPMGAASIVSGRAQSVPATFPSFTNTSGAPVTYYGTLLIDAGAGKLIDGTYFGLNTLPDGGITGYAPAISDRHE